MNMFEKEKTLREAQAEVRAGRDDGIDCPCCGKFNKRYKINLRSAMAYFLIALCAGWNKTDEEFIHVRDFMKAGQKASTDGVLLRHWRMIETAPNDDPTQKSSGMFKPTERGIQFAKNEIKVSAFIYTYNNKCEGFSNETVDIKEALGKKFDYSELMARGDK